MSLRSANLRSEGNDLAGQRELPAPLVKLPLNPKASSKAFRAVQRGKSLIMSVPLVSYRGPAAQGPSAEAWRPRIVRNRWASRRRIPGLSIGDWPGPKKSVLFPIASASASFLLSIQRGTESGFFQLRKSFENLGRQISEKNDEKRLIFDKSDEHEIRSSVYIHFPCACIADIRGLAPALSGQTRAATSRRSDRNRR